MHDWRLHLVTYNVGMSRGHEASIDAIVKRVTSAEPSPQFLVVALQEVPHAETVGSATDTWQSLLIARLNKKAGLVVLTKTYQATNQIIVFTVKSLLGIITNVDWRFSKTTMGGITGHKGSIGIRITFSNKSSVVFVASHFVHDAAMNDRRIAQYNSNTSCSYPEDRSVKAVFWLGDLNFRVELDSDEMLSLIAESKEQSVLETHDQLKQAMKSRKVFQGFKEPEIKFKPTYKLFMGTANAFDGKRTPSWTDRILSKSTGIDLCSTSYDSIAEALASDHLPVMAIYEMKFTAHLEPAWDVMFERLPKWYSTVPLIARFQMKNGYWSKRGSYRDWVAVYPAAVDDCTTALKWLWVGACLEQVSGGEKFVVCEFSELPPGSYRLGYFSLKSQCLVGLSKKFLVEQPQLAI